MVEVHGGEKLLRAWHQQKEISAYQGQNMNPEGCPRDLISLVTPYIPAVTTQLILIGELIHQLDYTSQIISPLKIFTLSYT